MLVGVVVVVVSSVVVPVPLISRAVELDSALGDVEDQFLHFVRCFQQALQHTKTAHSPTRFMSTTLVPRHRVRTRDSTALVGHSHSTGDVPSGRCPRGS